MSTYHDSHANSPLLLFLFFFQAEDGIRDPLVTGVQTCALPISVLLIGHPTKSARDGIPATWSSGRVVDLGGDRRDAAELTRSEERRVGKECRSRWSAYQ